MARRDDVQPFLAVIASTAQARPLGAALPAMAMPVAHSPWSPQPTAAQAGDASAMLELGALREQAQAEGRATGMRETAALRETLASLVAELTAARDALATSAADLIADAATAVVGAWADATDRAQLFAPVVRAWLARHQGEATAQVHPDEIAAMRAAVGDAPIAVTGDASLARGDVRIRGAALELAHGWDARLAELREAIATALEDKAS